MKPKQKTIFAWFFILMGLPFILISVNLLSIDESTLHAPKWVLGLCGFIFSLSGVIMLLGEKSHFNNLLAGLLILSFALVGGWVALFGSAEQFSGGLTVLSETQNVNIARVLFGIGSLICFAITIYAIRQHFKKKPYR